MSGIACWRSTPISAAWTTNSPWPTSIGTQACPDGQIVARADGYPTLLRMCEEGMGVAMLPRPAGQRQPAPAAAARTTQTIEVGVWAVIRQDVSHLPKIRTLMAFLTEAFLTLMPALSGTLAQEQQAAE